MMEPFMFYNPVRLLFGEGQTAAIDQYVPRDARVLITYGGGSILRNGIFDEVTAALGERYVTSFGGIEANPRYETLVKALDVIREHEIDFLLAVGGGSVIDGTKFIVAANAYPGEDKWEMVVKAPRPLQLGNVLPYGVVLTLSATGSEMNSGAVISREETHEKFSFNSERVFPQFSVIDPRHQLSLPKRQIANGVVDTFVHVVEQYLTYPVDARVQDRFSEGIMQTLVEVAPKVLESPEDMELRSNLAMAATMGLNGLIATGVPEDWSTHRIGHELTALFGIDHAVSLAIVLPSLLRDQLEAKQAKLAQCGARVFGIAEADEQLAARKTIDAIESFFRVMIGKIRLSDYGVVLGDAAVVWERFADRDWHLGERGTIDAAAVERILTAAL